MLQRDHTIGDWRALAERAVRTNGEIMAFGDFVIVSAVLASFVLFVETTEREIFNLSRRHYQQEGDINFGVILSMTGSGPHMLCKPTVKPTLSSIMTAEAYVFAIETINNNTNLLPDIKLGFHMLDDCNKQSVALVQALNFVPGTDGADPPMNVVGVLGPMTSSTSTLVAHLLSAYELPQVSYSATADELSDKTVYPYFIRLMPPDNYQVRDIILHLVSLFSCLLR